MPWAGLPQVKAALPRMAVLAGIWAGLTGLLLAAGAVVIHSAAITHFDQHVTRMVVDSRTTPLNSAMKAVTWLGSWVAIVVAAVIIAVLVWTRRLPVLALDVAVLMRAGETGGVQIGKTCPGPRAAPASHPPGSGSRLLVSFQPCRGGVPGVHGLGLMPGCAG